MIGEVADGQWDQTEVNRGSDESFAPRRNPDKGKTNLLRSTQESNLSRGRVPTNELARVIEAREVGESQAEDGKDRK